MSTVPLFGAGDCSTATAASGTGSALPVSKPSNVAVGDLLIGVFYSQFTGAVTAAPAGWTLLHSLSTFRGGGVYYLPVPDAAALAALASSWTQTMAGSGRLCDAVFRIPGANLANPIDVVGADVQNANATTTLTSVSPTNALGLLIAVAWWNNSSTAQSTFTPDAAMTDGVQVQSPTTGNTSGIDVAFQQLTAVGATGTRSFVSSPTGASNGGFMFVVNSAVGAAVNLTSAVALSASATPGGVAGASLTSAVALTASGSGTGGGVASLPVSVALSASSTVAVAATVNLAVMAALTASAATGMDQWLANPPLFVAHHGFSVNNPYEETLAAYTKAAAWSSTAALEMSVWKTPDNVWVASHDQTTGRIFAGTSYDITTTSWSTLQSLVSLVGGYPIAKAVDVLDSFPTRKFFVDNKGTQDVTGFFDMLDARDGKDRFVSKGYYTSVAVPTEAHARGYKTWGYYYDADSAQIASTHSRWDILGIEYAASSGSWTLAKAPGKPLLAHIVNDRAAKAIADVYAPTGYMASGFEVVAQTPAQVTLASAVALSAAGAAPPAASVTFPNSVGLTAASAAGAGAALSLVNVVALSAAVSVAPGVSVSLPVSVALSAGGSPAPGQAVSFIVSVDLTAAGAAGFTASVAFLVGVVLSAVGHAGGGGRDIVVLIGAPVGNVLRVGEPYGSRLRIGDPWR